MNNNQISSDSTSQKNTGAAAGNPGHARKTAIRVIVSVIASFVLGLVAYSIYVAEHEPDPQETIILGQTKIASASTAALRILVCNRVSGKPVRGATVEVSLQAKAGGAINLGHFRTDNSGSLADPIAVPDIVPGEYQLIVDSASPLGRDHIVQKIQIQHPARILLSSDKPVYQAGQTIHLRSLILNARTQAPLTNEPVTFEVSDSRGNKVFKETHPVSAFGIASADFVLASEVNLGRYELRVLAGPASAERLVEIKRYVLPKFKIQIATDKPYYLPGQTVSGSVQADYFFGKPVGDAETTLTVSTLQEQRVAVTTLQGKTDATGRYSFQFALPDFFAGLPQNNRQAVLDLTAEIQDTAQHREEKTMSLSVAQNELNITAIPEAGALVPGVENILYVLTAYPDGRPAACRIFVDGAAHQSDAEGVCEVKFVPATSDQPVEIRASDPAGRGGKFTFRADAQSPVPAFLLRTDKAVYQTGDTARVRVLSPEPDNTVFLDLIKDGQTVLTKSVPLNRHQAEYSFALPASLVGALKLNAYVISELGEDRGCSRTIYVNPASGLHLATKLSQTVYRPGETAKLDIAVTGTDGRPVPAALGIAVVDESVFAVAENRPGLLQQFLEAEGELMKPRYQIKSFESPGALLTSGNQNLAKAWLASLAEVPAGPDLAQLVKDDLIPQKLIEHVRNLRDTPAYEQLRQDPQYAAVFRLLENEGSVYSLREATGPVKLRAAAAHRLAYFSHLKKGLVIGLTSLLFISPVLLLIYYFRPGAGINPQALAQRASAEYVGIVGSLHYMLAALTLLPLLCYPAGFALLEERLNKPGWILLGFEIVIVCLVALCQLLRLSAAGARGLNPEVNPLRVYLVAYIGQFILSRAVLAIMVLDERVAEDFAVFWVIASLVAPLVVLGSLGSHIDRQLVAQGMTAKVTRMSVMEIVLVIFGFAILAGMLLPALASAKAKAQRASLQNDLKQIELASQEADASASTPGATGSAPPRIRRDFPETLLW